MKNATVFLIIFFIMTGLTACGGKYYTKDDLQGIWYDKQSEVAWAFNGGEYILGTSLIGTVEQGKFDVNGSSLTLNVTESKVEKNKNSSKYNIKIEDDTLYMTNNDGEVLQYVKISVDDLREEWDLED